MRNIPDDNLTYPVLVQRPNGNGSAFFLNTGPVMWLVTAKHVLFSPTGQLKSDTARLTSYCADLVSRVNIDLDLRALLGAGNILQHAVADVAVVRLANVQQVGDMLHLVFNPGVQLIDAPPPGQRIVGASDNVLLRYAGVLVSNEVFLFGYPNSVGTELQVDRSRPLLRHGIVAGKNDTNSTIIIDCPVYQGNSGGLVLQVHQENLVQKRFRVIGVVTETLFFVERLKSIEYGHTNYSVANSGYAVVWPVDTIFDLVGAPAEVPQNPPAA